MDKRGGISSRIKMRPQPGPQGGFEGGRGVAKAANIMSRIISHKRAAQKKIVMRKTEREDLRDRLKPTQRPRPEPLPRQRAPESTQYPREYGRMHTEPVYQPAPSFSRPEVFENGPSDGKYTVVLSNLPEHMREQRQLIDLVPRQISVGGIMVDRE
jgi:hypothetical protein